MKLKKVIAPILTLPIVSTTCTSFSSCSFESHKEEAEQYIYDRTFSILNQNDKYLCWGTGWIIDDATPTIEDDYCYYMATNWHVKLGHEQLQSNKYAYCDNDSSRGCDVTDFVRFSSFQYEDESNFIFEEDTQYKYGIDFYVARVDFGNKTSSKVKTKLNNLNDFRKTNGHITDFVDANTTRYDKLDMYTGGFPVQRDYYATWEFHEIKSYHLEAFDWAFQDQTDSWPHLINNKEDPIGIIDVAPGYRMKEIYAWSPKYMIGGASGSMLLSRIDNKFKVVGIYWGYFQQTGQTNVMPTFSILRSQYKDFIKPYLK